MRAAPELLGRAAPAVGAALAAVLVPKCPLCVAAYLAAFGMSAAAADAAAPLVRPAAFALVGLATHALLFGARRLRQRQRRRAAPRCCRH